PAGSSVAAGLLLHLAELGQPDLRALADGTLAAFATKLLQIPQALPQMLCALDTATRPGAQIVVAGEKGDARTQALLAVVPKRYLPGRIPLLADAAARAELGVRMPWIAGMGEVAGRPAAYVCRDHTCERPVTEPEALADAVPKVQIS